MRNFYIVLIILISNSAFGKDRREGFNFGTGLRLVGSQDSTFASSNSDKNSQNETSGQAVTPYAAYAFQYVNLGVSFYQEKVAQTIQETSTDGQQQIKRASTSETKGASLFGRLLFGKVMYLELGGGYYANKVAVDNEVKNLSGGTFQGTTNSYSLNTAGVGGHYGAGIELPVVNGFYFTGSYIIRIMQLRDMSGDSELGTKKSSSEKHELGFGLAYYY